MLLQTVDRALGILQLLAREGRALPVRDIAEELGMKVTSTYHHVNTLAARGFVTHRDREVQLGPAITEIAAAYRRQFSFSRDIEPVLDKAVEETRETTYLGVWTGRNVVLQAVRESDQSVRVGGLYVGYSGNEFVRASGRAVLAFLTPGELEAFRAALSSDDRERIERLDLDQILSDIRQHGYAIDRGEFSPGVACVAAPVMDENGRVAGAVAISAPLDRFDQSVDGLTRSVVTAAAQVTDQLGGKPIGNVVGPLGDGAILERTG